MRESEKGEDGETEESLVLQPKEQYLRNAHSKQRPLNAYCVRYGANQDGLRKSQGDANINE